MARKVGPDWTVVRVRTVTKKLVHELKQFLTEAYEEGRSPIPIRNPDHGMTDDEVVYKACRYFLRERLRKNRPKGRKAEQSVTNEAC